jgi:hypothetical protein
MFNIKRLMGIGSPDAVQPVSPVRKTGAFHEKQNRESSTDSVDLSDVSKLTSALQEAEEALKQLPKSETIKLKVLMLKARLEELKNNQL